jgi:hypothetical protein
MALGKAGMLTALLGLVVWGGAAWAQQQGPPSGEYGMEWYEGIWQVTIQESCHRHTDGGATSLPVEHLYMRLETYDPDYGVYSGALFLDSALQNQVGYMDIAFDYPYQGTTYLADGEGNKELFINGQYRGWCHFSFQGVLSRTQVNRWSKALNEKRALKLQTKSLINGWNLAWCQYYPEGAPKSPANGVDGLYLKCESSWKARWMAPLPAEDPD